MPDANRSERPGLSVFRSLPAEHAELIPVEGHGGLRLNLYRLKRRPAGGPVILFGHACGFAAGSYLPLFERLADEIEILSFDARGHGGSDAPPAAGDTYSAESYALDLIALGRKAATIAAGRPLFFVGHSLNAAAMLRLGACHPGQLRALGFRGMLLFEPPVFPSADRPEHAECREKDRKLIARTLARRERFASPEDLVGLLTGRGLFKHLAPEFLRAHAQATLRPLNDGDGFTLACPPAVESATFAAFGEDSTFRRLGEFPAELPVRLVGGDPDSGPDRNWTTIMAPVLVDRLSTAAGAAAAKHFIPLRERGHLMVQEDPTTACQLIHELIQASDSPTQ